MEKQNPPQRRRQPTLAEMTQNCWNCAGYDMVSERSNSVGKAANSEGQRIADMLF